MMVSIGIKGSAVAFTLRLKYGGSQLLGCFGRVAIAIATGGLIVIAIALLALYRAY